MKKLFICLVILTASLTALSARNLQLPENTGKLPVTYNQDNVSTPGNADYGVKYFRSNSHYRFQVDPLAQLRLDNVKADLKVISWDKEYAEIEIMKVSNISQADLDNCDVWIDNNTDITLGTSFDDPASEVMVNIVVKLPQSIEPGTLYDHRSELKIKNIDPVRFYAR
jgi:hypothetical protein